MAGEDVLTYMITAHDLATPVFRAFGGQVKLVSEQVRASALEMNKSMAGQQVQMSKVGASSKLMGAEQIATAKSVAAQQSRVVAATDGATAAAGRSKTALGGVAAASTAAGTASHDMSGKMRGATTEIQKHKAGIQETGYALSGFSRQLGPFGNSLDTAARHAQLFRSKGIDYLAAGVVGLAATVAFEGVKAAASFDKLIAGMQTQAGVGKATATDLVGIVKQVSTQSVGSYQEIAGAVAAQYQLFGRNADMIKKNTDLFVAFADQAGTPTKTSVQQLSQMMRQFHPAGMSVVDMMDQLVNLSQKTQQPLQGYVDVLSHFGPQLSAMGLGFKQTEGLFAGFSKGGVSATGVGRGLTTALTFATKAIADAQSAATLGGKGGMTSYANAIDTAKSGVLKLHTELANGKITQAQYSATIDIANSKLDTAKQKYTAMAAVVNVARQAHMTTSGVIQIETQHIEQAKTKTEALNIAMQVFGKRLGPAMADALWHNKQGLEAMTASLGDAHKKTEDLAAAQRDTLSGQLKILGHDFTNIAGTVGSTLLPVLRDGVHILGALTTGIQQFSSGSTKGLAEALAGIAVGGGALTLLARHTPLGAVTSSLPGSLGSILSRQGGGAALPLPTTAGSGGLAAEGLGGIWGLTGPIKPGSRINPLAVIAVGGGMGSSTGGIAGGRLASAETVAAAESRTAGGVILPPGVNAAAATTTAATVAPEVAGAGMMGMLGAGASRLMHGGMIAGGGFMAAQAVGSLVGGKTGSTISSLGSGAAIGAGIGSMIVPGVGTAIGAALGGLGVEIAHLLSSKSYGDKVAGNLSRGFAPTTGADASNTRAEMSRLLNEAAALNHPSRVMPGPRGRFSMGTGSTPGVETQAQKDKANQDQFLAGQAMAKQLEAGWAQYKFQSEPVMFKQFGVETRGLPVRAQEAAMQSAVAFSQGLEKNKQVPIGSTRQFIVDVQKQFPALTNYMGVSAGASIKTFTAALDFSHASSNVKKAMQGMSGDFSSVQAAMTQTQGSTTVKAGAMVKALQSIVTHGTGPMKALATADLHTLEGTVASDFGAMGDLVNAKMHDISGAVASGSMAVARSSAKWWGQYVRSIQEAETAGVLTVQTGNKMIAAELAKAFQALGVSSGLSKKLASQGFSVSTVASDIASGTASGYGQVGIGGGPAINATGGRVPGPVGPDNWTLMDPSGRAAAMVGGGELLIANRHTEADLSAATMAVYGKTAGQMVAGETAPHSATRGFAKGGRIVTASDFGGRNDPGAYMHQTASGRVMNDSLVGFAELSNPPGSLNFSALGHLPMGTMMPVTYGGKTITIPKVDVGAGGPGLGGHIRAVDLTQPAANQLGFPGLANIIVGDPSGISLGGGGGGAQFVPISTPRVHGDGMVAALAQKVLNKVTGAANQKLALAAAMANTTRGGGTSGTINPNFAVNPKSRIPPQVQVASEAARAELGKPYLDNGVPGGYGLNAAGLDCSGYVSTVLNAAGLDPAGHLLTGGLKSWGQPGEGKYITVGVWGADSGPSGHTMMEINGTFFESGGGPQGPHIDSGWSMNFPWKRHPAGLAVGGRVGPSGPGAGGLIGSAGHQMTRDQMEHGSGYAGKFGQGGSFTATKPTMAMFGDNGPEDVYAIPHASTGITPALLSANQVAANFNPGPGSGKRSAGSSSHTAFNSATGQIETHTSAEWAIIRAQNALHHFQTAAQNKAAALQRKAGSAATAAQRKAAAALAKAHAHWLAATVTDTLTAEGKSAGSIETSRRTAFAEGLPGGGQFSITGRGISGLDNRGYSSVSAAFNKSLAGDTLGQQMGLAGSMSRGLAHGADASMIRQESALTRQLNDLNRRADRRESQAQTLHTKGLEEHGRQRRETMGRAHADHLEAQRLRHQAGGVSHKVDALDLKIAASRPARLANQAITAAAKSVASEFASNQTTYTDAKDTRAAIESLGGGTAKSMGLSALQLKGLGLSAPTVKALAAGGSTGPAADAATIAYIKGTELPGDTAEAKKLESLYKDALKTHNKRLQGSLLTQLDGVTKAMIVAQSSLKAAMIALITDTAAAFSAKSASYGASFGLLGGFQGLAPGTSLASLGMTAEQMQTMGMSSALVGLEGSSTSYLQNKISTTGAPLTAAEMSSARTGAYVANIGATYQMGPLQQEMAYYQQQISSGNLTGTDRASAVDAMTSLGSQIIALQGTITTNNAGIQQLTKANLDATAAIDNQQVSAIGGSSTLLSTISELSSGTNLAAMGLTPDILAAGGLNPYQAAGLTGSGPAALAAAQAKQNNKLTAGQITAGQAGYAAQNSILSGEQAPIMDEIRAYQAEIPNLTGADAASAKTAIAGLIQQLAALGIQIQTNTAASAALTAATTANTNATGQMTGSVSYSYNNQEYSAGGSMTSDNPANVSVGL